jgi:K(+)-stimulated pyrophosphate-energized sodium pump
MEMMLASLAAQADPAATLPFLWWLGPIGAVIALSTAFYLYRKMMEESEGTPEMIEIAEAVRVGAQAYLRAQYRVITAVFAVMFILFIILAAIGAQSPFMPLAFVTAGLASGVAGYIGMRSATNASARTANAARESLDGGLRVAFRGGAVMGMAVVGMALADISIWFLVLYYFIGLPVPAIATIQLSAAAGASTMALFGRVGGGIYTKAADVGADLVGKVEAGIPEDDPRNPATIADNVGDNVGDVAGMGADLYESFNASILSAVALGVAGITAAGLGTDEMLKYVTAPFMIAGLGVIAAVIGIFFVRAEEGASMKDLMWTMERSIFIAAGIIAAASYILLDFLQLANHYTWQVWLALVIGLLVGIGIGRITEYYTSGEYTPTQGIAGQALTGPGTVIIDGLAVGMRSTGIPVILVVVGSGVAYFVAGGFYDTLLGLFGVALAAVGMLSTLGITLATDAYGPIADNAGGNAEMSGLPSEVRGRTDQLDAVGNTTAATGKGFAIGSAALTGLALLASYAEQVRFGLLGQGVEELVNGAMVFDVATMGLEDFMLAYSVHPLNPMFLLGMFIGAMIAFFFCALTMSAVGRSAQEMVLEVRRQFAEMPGIMEGTQKPDYARCVEISTRSALREMIVPSVLALVAPILVGLIMGVAGVLGLLSGGLATAFCLALMMSNAGGAWDNAKKYIEEGHHGGKGSEAHKAAVVGDTVGDPFKDTSGPSLNILIKLMSMVSIVFAGAVVLLGNGQGLLMMLFGG